MLNCYFHESGNSYRLEIFSVTLIFNRVSNDISLILVA